MRLGKVIAGICLALTASVSATEANNTVGLSSQLNQVAGKIGIPLDDYLHAVQVYQNLHSGSVEREYKLLHEMDSVIEYQWYLNAGQVAPPELEDKYQAERNLQQMQFANQLGLDVAKLDRFQEVYNTLSGKGQFEELRFPNVINLLEEDSKFSPQSDETQFERILIRCDAECASGGKSSGIPFSLAIAIKASQAGIPESIRYVSTNPFAVVFQDSNGNNVKMERWMHNSFSGAWKDGNLPCARCEVTKPQ